MTPTTVATVGGTSIGETALRDGVQQDLQNYRQQQPSLDIVSFVQGGGIEGSLSRLIDGVAFTKFAESQGMRVSKRLVDGQIASIPALQGPDGQLSPEIYKRDRKSGVKGKSVSVRVDLGGRRINKKKTKTERKNKKHN